MAEIYFDVDVALSEVPVNIFPLTDDTDFKARKTSVGYDAAGMDLVCGAVGADEKTNNCIPALYTRKPELGATTSAPFRWG